VKPFHQTTALVELTIGRKAKTGLLSVHKTGMKNAWLDDGLNRRDEGGLEGVVSVCGVEVDHWHVWRCRRPPYRRY
jgi:hypothetical protein